ncbi:RNB-domain-containing protein [Hesseltinella vesiculosa]|uniref:RNB-domain-containing protein n=1 Tax=Hesseltinella vesiculosa TaxID=101127 RepID=A0A1X2GBP8_9FUNG|nr:RNB-domain-containing protein [Hesseltinella vesiculosa]
MRRCTLRLTSRLCSTSFKPILQRSAPSAAPLARSFVLTRPNFKQTTPSLTLLAQDPDLKLSSEEQALAEFTLPTLRVGDYVVGFRRGEFSGMVVEQHSIAGRQQRLTVLMRNGRTKTCRSSDIAFVATDFARSNHITSFQEPLQIDRRANAMPLPERLDSLQRAIQNYQRTIRMTKGAAILPLEQLYPALTKHSKGQSVLATLDDLTAQAFPGQPVTDDLRHSTFTYLVANPIHFVPKGHPLTGLWELRPQSQVDTMTQVVDAVRNGSPAYRGFLNRAAERVQYAQAHMHPQLGTLTADESAHIRASMPWQPEDTVFLNFLLDWVKLPQVITDSPHQLFGPTLLKNLRCYENLFVDRALATQCLRHLGIFRPWDNTSLFDNLPVVRPFFWSDDAQQHRHTMERLVRNVQKHQRNKEEAQTWRQAVGFYDKDPCDHLRHDFGSLPVYTIDDPNAKEIDDGISIETTQDGTTWLHVHIADPTTYVPPTHPLAAIMTDRAQTLYLPEAHYPLLPNALASQTFSLGTAGADRLDGGAQYALTFSATVSPDGQIDRYHVRPSLVRHVVRLSYDQVDALAFPQQRQKLETEQFGPLLHLPPVAHPAGPDQSQPSKSTHLPLTGATSADLAALSALMRRHWRQRIDQGSFDVVRPRAHVDLAPSPLPLPAFSVPSNPNDCHLYGTALPTISVSLDRASVSPARKLVAEAMIIAGRVASRFAQDHGIPMPFRAQNWRPGDEATRDALLACRDLDSGYLRFQDLLAHVSKLPPASLTTQHGQPHVLMGIPDGYCKTTSPLRRYTDMMAHWQIKAHLLRDRFPFDVQTLQDLGPRLELKEKQMGMVQQQAEQYWVLQLLQRLQPDNRVWQCIVHEPNRLTRTNLGGFMEATSATLLDLGITVRIEHLKSAVHTGDQVAVRLSSIDPSADRVNVVQAL